VPAAFAAAELTNASGADFLAGMIGGYEVALRLAQALPAGSHYDRGFHPSATCGAFGAAIAAARVLKLGEEATLSALGVALSQTAGSLQFLANGAWTKRFQVGWASMSGFSAAILAREGFIGAAEPIEGKYGFLRSYAPVPDPERAVSNLGEVWELSATGIKPYPSCRWGHAGIDAALSLRAEHDLAGQEIEEATYGLCRAGMLLIGEPAERKANPANTVDAQFSGPFVIASALMNGRMNWDDYRALEDPDLRTLTRKIRCERDPEMEALFPEHMAGRLTLHARGKVYSHTIIDPKGEPQNFPTPDELFEKFADLASVVVGAERTRRLAEATFRVDRLKSAHDLWG
jgi:2-methylcitrate dehydratase PrpD